MERIRDLGPLTSRFGSRTIGVDVDRGALKAVQVSSGGGAYTLQHVGYHRLPPGAVVDGEVADVVLLGAEIKAFWESHSFKSRSVVLGVANQKVVVRTLNMPRMEPEDLAGAIGYEARDHIPMPLEEAVLDHAVLGPDLQSPEEDRVLVVAAQRKMIGRFAAAARAGGLRPVGIDVKALSLTRSTLPEDFFADEDAVLLLDVGTELTSLTITQGREPVLTRLLPTGLDAFVAAVEETADLDAEEAERHALNPRAMLGYDAERFEESAPTGEAAEDELDPVLVYDVRRGLEAAAKTWPRRCDARWSTIVPGRRRGASRRPTSPAKEPSYLASRPTSGSYSGSKPTRATPPRASGPTSPTSPTSSFGRWSRCSRWRSGSRWRTN